MSSPKILLHLGLPKTATTSLQHNVFQKLHEQGALKFLGKCLDYDEKTSKVVVRNYSGKLIRDAAEGSISIHNARFELETLLSRELLNVFSDEGIMVAYPGKYNLPLVQKIKNLRELFDGFDVKVVVTLRDPVDYLYSLYVQLYPDFRVKERSLGSIDRYIDGLISQPNSIFFESFHFDLYIPEIRDNFNLFLLSYEDLTNNKKKVYGVWSDLLGVSESQFMSLFESRKANEKSKSGKEVQKVKDFKSIELFLRNKLSSNYALYKVAKLLYKSLRLGYFFNYRFKLTSTHPYPSGARLEKLRSSLKTDDTLHNY